MKSTNFLTDPSALSLNLRKLLNAIAFLALLTFLVFGFLVYVKMIKIGDAHRAAFSQTFTRGIPLYFQADGTPGLMTHYGPIYPLAFLPCVLGNTTASSTKIAYFMNLMYATAPLFLAVWSYLRLRERRLDASSPGLLTALGLFGCTGVLCCVTAEYQDMIFTLHIDSFISGMQILACCLVTFALVRRKEFLLVTAAFLIVLPVFSKITALPPVFAPFVLLFFLNRRYAIIYLVSAMLFLLIMGSTYLMIYGGDILLRNMVQNPTAAPPRQDLVPNDFVVFSDVVPIEVSTLTRIKALVRVMEINFWPLFGMVGIIALLFIRLLGEKKETVPAPALSRIDSTLLLPGLLLAIGLFSCPGTFVGISKTGAGPSSQASVCIPLITAMVLLGYSVLHRQIPPVTKLIYVVLGLIFVSVPLCLVNTRNFAMLRRPTVDLNANYRLLKEYPGKLFFPGDPLSHILAEGRMIYDVDVVRSFSIAGVPPNVPLLRKLAEGRQVVFDKASNPSDYQILISIYPESQISPTAETALEGLR